MLRNVFDHTPHRLQNPARRGVGGIEPAEHMRQFGKADGRVVADAISQQFIDNVRRAPLQDVETREELSSFDRLDTRAAVRTYPEFFPHYFLNCGSIST